MVSRIAVLVLAHRAEPLPFLVTLLGEPFEIFIHYDAKSGKLPDLKAPNARYITQRHAIFWGGFSMVEASLDLLSAALAVGGFERFLFISGDTIPTRHPEHLAEALLWPHVEYIGLQPIQNDPSTRGQSRQVVAERWGNEHPGRFYNFQYWDSLLTNPFTEADLMREYGLDQVVAQQLRGQSMEMVRILTANLPSRQNLFLKFFYGSQWWGITPKLVNLLSNRIFSENTKEYFRLMEVPDEHYLPCIVGNYQDELKQNGQCILGAPVFTDYAARAAGQNFVSATMLRAAATEQALLMRKFDPVAAPDVADAIRAGRYHS